MQIVTVRVQEFQSLELRMYKAILIKSVRDHVFDLVKQ